MLFGTNAFEISDIVEDEKASLETPQVLGLRNQTNLPKAPSKRWYP